MNFYTYAGSPLGELLLISDGDVFSGLYMQSHKIKTNLILPGRRDDRLPLFIRSITQLGEYFAQERTIFELPLKMEGTAFQKSVWQELSKIPYGTRTTYTEIARRLARPTAARAVGLANAGNPVSIIVPCHRVIGQNGSLTGYAGGLERKEFLLQLESGLAGLKAS